MSLETYEPPQTLTKYNVIYWCEEYKSLEGIKSATAIQTKARKFLQYDCIEETETGFICKPIPGYNKTVYHIINKRCSCQYNKKEELMCSHLLAMYLYLKLRDWNGKDI